MNFEFMNNPIVPGYQNQPQPPFNTQFNGMQQQQVYYQPQPQPIVEEQPITPPPSNTNNGGSVLGYGFTVRPDNAPPDPKYSIVEYNNGTTAPAAPRKRKPKKTEEPESVDSSTIITADQTEIITEQPTLYNYAQTTMLLHNTLQQVDTIASEMKEELDSTRANRTLRNKHNYIVGLTNSISQLLNTKATLIREINNSITKSVELDYRKEKDRKASEQAVNDDRYIMDLYNAFVQNPNAGGINLLGPNPLNATVNSIDSSSIIRSPLAQQDMPTDQPVDIGYLNYLSRITPEQNAMFYEQDPNVKTVVVFDASTGNKFFQVMNVATGQVVPNVPVLDNRFMEDTTLDVKNRIARNNNLHESYPLIVINEGVTNEY